MANQVTLHIKGGLAAFGTIGIDLTPWFAHQPVHIPWANVMFVSPVPSVRRNGSEWHTFRGDNITPDALRSALMFYCFEVALNARADLLELASFFTRSWLLTTVWLKPLYVADDQPHPSNGCIKLYLRKRWLRRNGNSLLTALDLIERFSKFDLLATVD
jgi:hypothetical protein